jgi:hypothetical protein
VGYLVETSGRLKLPQELERQALTVLEVRMGARGGWFDADQVHVDSLEELAPYAAAQVRREGEWLLVGTDTDGDPKWSEQASEFYRSLGSFVREGEVHVRGEDGQAWSYLYSGDGVLQRGDNGWDGTPGDPAAGPVPPAPTPPGVSPPPPAASGPTAAGAPEPPAQPAQFRYPGSDERPAPPPPAAPQSYAPGDPGDPGSVAESPSYPGPPTGLPEDRVQRAWADPPPASAGRTALMVGLLVVGVVLIIGLALLVSGL